MGAPALVLGWPAPFGLRAAATWDGDDVCASAAGCGAAGLATGAVPPLRLIAPERFAALSTLALVFAIGRGWVAALAAWTAARLALIDLERLLERLESGR